MKNSKYLTYLGLAIVFIMPFILFANIDINKTGQLALVTPIAGGETITVIRQSCIGYAADTCFTSLSAWESNYGGIDFTGCTTGDLTCVNTSAVARIEGSWTNPDTTAVTINGWTTSATNYIRIYTDSTARHDGKWNTSAYQLEITGSGGITNSEDFVRIEGLQISHTVVDMNYRAGIFSQPGAISDTRFSHNIIKGIIRGTSANNYGIRLLGPSGATEKAFNNIIYNYVNGANINTAIVGNNSNKYVYNNTIFNSYIGIWSSSGIILAKNNVVQRSSNSYYGTTFDANSDYNISDVNQADADSVNATFDGYKTVSFVSTTTPGSEDFHLSTSDTSAKDAGTELSADANLAFTTDIDGETRSGTWDIGADEQSGSTLPLSTYQCNDGSDNDGDGLTDYPNDPGCSSTTDNDEYNAPTGDTTAPTTPTNLTATTVSTSQINLAWTTSTDNTRVTGYRIYRNGTQITTTTNTYYSNTGLTSNTSYSYTVRAYDAAGNLSNNSSSVSVKTNTTSTIEGSVYYIDYVNGSDSNNGTSTATPFKHSPGDQDATGNATITLSASDTVVFKGGVTYEFDGTGNNYIAANASGTAGNKITYTSGHTEGAPWGVGRAIIDCTNATPLAAGVNGCIYLSNYAYLTVKDMEIKNLATGSDSTGLIGWKDGNTGTNAQLLIDNVYGHNSDGAIFVARGRFSVGTVASNITIQNSTMESTWGHVIKLEYSMSDVLIANNTFDKSGTDPYASGTPAGNNIALTGGEEDNTNGQTNVTIRGNTLQDTTTSGNKSLMLIQNVTTNLLFEDNYLFGYPKVSALDFINKVTTAKIRNNVFHVHPTNFEGIIRIYSMYPTATDATINGLEIHNNTFVSETSGGAGIIYFRVAGYDADVLYSNVDIRNNIVDSDTDTNNYLIWIGNNGSAAPVVEMSTFTVDYNAYQNLNSSNDYFYVADDGGGRTFSEWKSYLASQGVSGADANSSFGQVAFTNEAGNDFTLNVNDTMALEEGINLASEGFMDDIFGVTRGSLWDIGAYEYVVKGTTYYVDYVSGADTNNGTTISTPFKHSPGDQDATGTASTVNLGANDTVVFKGGVVYSFDGTGDNYIAVNSSGSAGQPITYISGDVHSSGWGTGSAKIDCTNGNIASVTNGRGIINIIAQQYITIKGLEMYNFYNGGVGTDYKGLIGWSDTNTATDANLIIDDVTLYNTIGSGIVVRGTYNGGSTDASNFIIRNSTMYDSTFHLIKLEYGLTNVLVENNNFDKAGSDPYVTGAPVANCIGHTVGGATAVQTNVTVRGNTFNDSTGTDNKGLVLVQIDQENLIYENNVFLGTPRTGTWNVTAELTNTIIRNNVFHVYPTNFAGVLRFYYGLDSGPGDCDGIDILNNTFVGTSPEGSEGSLIYFKALSDPNIQFKNVTIKNNILDSDLSTNTNLIYIGNTTDGSNIPVVELATLDIDYNTYQSLDTTAFYTQAGGGTLSFTVWKSYLSTNGVAGADANSSFGQVAFTNEAGNDFTLSSTDTMALDKGTDLSSYFTTDKDGISRPQESAWDIGAYEYNEGTTPPLTTYQCSDGSDNDNDSLTDYPSDPGCTSTTDDNEYNAPVVIDTTAPTNPTITINGGTLTNSRTVTLSLSATDNIAVTQMSFSNEGGTYSSWETYSTTKTHTLSSVNGTKTVSVLYRDNAGNISTSANDSINLDNTAPTISGISLTTTSSTTATVKWNTNELSTTQIEYGFSTNYGTQTTLNSSLITSHTANLINLSPDNTTYHYRVRSTDSANNQAISTDRTFTTPGLTDVTSPSAVTDLTASDVSQTSASLTWTSPGDDGTEGISAAYDIRYSTNTLTSANWPDATQVTGEPTPSISGSVETLYITVGLQANTLYHMGIRSRDDTGNLSYVSNIISFTTLAEDVTPVTPPSPPTGGGGGGGGGGIFIDTTAPNPVTNLRASSADSQVTLSWKNPTDTDFARVLVLRSTNIINTLNKSVDELRNTYDVIYEGDKQEYTDANLNNSQTYYYAVSTYDKKPNYSSFVTLVIKPEAGKESFVISEPEVTTDSSTSQPLTILFTQNLWFGLQNDNVKKLQELFARDKSIYPEGITTGYFGLLTQKAVQRFQVKYNLVSSGSPTTTGYGSVGPKTREKLNEVYGTSTSNTPSNNPITNFVRLTIEQINAILNLLVAFGTDNPIVETVRGILMGE